MSRASNYSLRAVNPAPSKGADGKFQRTKGDRLIEAHRALKAKEEAQELRDKRNA